MDVTSGLFCSTLSREKLVKQCGRRNEARLKSLACVGNTHARARLFVRSLVPRFSPSFSCRPFDNYFSSPFCPEMAFSRGWLAGWLHECMIKADDRDRTPSLARSLAPLLLFLRAESGHRRNSCGQQVHRRPYHRRLSRGRARTAGPATTGKIEIWGSKK